MLSTISIVLIRVQPYNFNYLKVYKSEFSITFYNSKPHQAHLCINILILAYPILKKYIKYKYIKENKEYNIPY